MKKYIIVLIGALLVFSCRLEEKERKGPLFIVATTGIIEDVIENIVAEKAEVSALMGPGTDPHLYKPTPGDIELLDRADVIICNGLHLEGKMAEMLDKYAQDKPVLKVSDGIAKNSLIKSANFEDSYDPHIWFDTEIWLQGIKKVTEELGELDSVNQIYFSQNFTAYQAEVEALDSWIYKTLEEIEDAHKVLITSHDAFSYFGRRYKVDVRGIQGISTLSEVGLKDISEMVDFVIEKNIKSIFVETSTSNKTAQSIVDGAKSKGYKLLLDGPLYSDALGEPGGDGGDYISMIKTNVSIIVKGLKR
jgi:manganese/zinc/iron transport system substrate-binding protein